MYFYFVRTPLSFSAETRWDATGCCGCDVRRSVSTAGLLHFFVLTERELVTCSWGMAFWQTHPPVGVRKSSSSSSAPNMFIYLFLFFTVYLSKSKSPSKTGQIWCMSSLLHQNFPFPIWKERQVTSSQLTRVSTPFPAPHCNSLLWTVVRRMRATKKA